MKLLLDKCLDWRLRRDLPGHEVRTVQEMGWDGIKNGRLLNLAQAEFQVFITGDRNLSPKQNLSGFSVAVVVLQAASIRLVHTRPLTPGVLALLPSLQPGQVVAVAPRTGATETADSSRRRVGMGSLSDMIQCFTFTALQRTAWRDRR